MSAPDRIAGATAAALQPAGAQDLRRFLVGRIDRLQRRRREQIDVRERVRHRHQDEARHREDVEGEGRRAHHIAQKRIDEPGIWAEQGDVGDCQEKGRREIGERRREAHECLAGEIGARDRPGERHADRDAEKRAQRAQLERVQQRGAIERARQHPNEIAQRKPAVLGKAAIKKKEDRQHDEHGDRERSPDRDDMLRAQPPRFHPALPCQRRASSRRTKPLSIACRRRGG